MPQVYRKRVTKGAVRLERRWQPVQVLDPTTGELQPEPAPYTGGGGSNAGRPGPSTAGRVQTTLSPRTRRAMRYTWSALPWELLGHRPVLITLTPPRWWRGVVADSSALSAARKALKERWRRRWGDPVGVWVVEFQPRKRRPAAERLAPHIHLYVALPDAVSEKEYEGFVARTVERKRLERKHGSYDGRRRTPPIEGEFAAWLLRSWSEVLGTAGEGATPEVTKTWKYNRRRGVDVTAAFWSDQAERDADRARIAEYFFKESGKWQQKTPPADFGPLHFHGRWGDHLGFRPMEEVELLETAEYLLQKRVLVRCLWTHRREAARKGGYSPKKVRIRGRDGVTVFTPRSGQLSA